MDNERDKVVIDIADAPAVIEALEEGIAELMMAGSYAQSSGYIEDAIGLITNAERADKVKNELAKAINDRLAINSLLDYKSSAMDDDEVHRGMYFI